jgi:hypothetical protein
MICNRSHVAQFVLLSDVQQWHVHHFSFSMICICFEIEDGTMFGVHVSLVSCRCNPSEQDLGVVWPISYLMCTCVAISWFGCQCQIIALSRFWNMCWFVSAAHGEHSCIA